MKFDNTILTNKINAVNFYSATLINKATKFDGAILINKVTATKF